MARAAAAARRGHLDRARRQRGGDRAGVGDGRRAVRRRHRPDVGPRRARRLRARPRSRSTTRPSLRETPARRVRPPRDGARWPTTSGRCSPSSAPARSSSTTATTCAPRRRRPASPTRSTTRASCRRSSGRSSARAAGPFRWAALSGDPGGHPAHRPGDPRAVPRRRRPRAAGSRWPQERVPFQGLPARICWLGYGERAQGGPRVQRAGRGRARSRRRSSSGATTSTPARSPRRTARPRRCATARTPSPTGRCSTRWSTPRPARRGCRSTTAAASASATASTPAWSSSRTAPSSPPQKLERVLTTRPRRWASLRHVDAGYERAIEVARERGVRVPMLDGA